MKVLPADVACVTTSAAWRGEVADFDSARKGARALMALVCSMLIDAVASTAKENMSGTLVSYW